MLALLPILRALLLELMSNETAQRVVLGELRDLAKSTETKFDDDAVDLIEAGLTKKAG